MPQPGLMVARVAAPPSPDRPHAPVPANVLSVPLEESIDMRQVPLFVMTYPAAYAVTLTGLLSREDVAGRPSPE